MWLYPVLGIPWQRLYKSDSAIWLHLHRQCMYPKTRNRTGKTLSVHPTSNNWWVQPSTQGIILWCPHGAHIPHPQYIPFPNDFCHLICSRKPLALPFTYDIPHLIAQFRVALHVFYPSQHSFIPTVHHVIHLIPSLEHPCGCVGSTDGESVERTWALLAPPVNVNQTSQWVQYKAHL